MLVVCASGLELCGSDDVGYDVGDSCDLGSNF